MSWESGLAGGPEQPTYAAASQFDHPRSESIAAPPYPGEFSTAQSLPPSLSASAYNHPPLHPSAYSLPPASYSSRQQPGLVHTVPPSSHIAATYPPPAPNINSTLAPLSQPIPTKHNAAWSYPPPYPLPSQAPHYQPNWKVDAHGNRMEPEEFHLGSHQFKLDLRQQPREALVFTKGKERNRRPVDPPPVIQLKVESHADPEKRFLSNPYLFMCVILYKVDKDEPVDPGGHNSLVGSLVSSLHRLKDVDNTDGGFFVFGDISVKTAGTFRLHFSLFDLYKKGNPSGKGDEIVYLGSVTSQPFKVSLQKDFKGMEESTYLSRAFSDQGVRLKLRKEPRAVMGSKRSYGYIAESHLNSFENSYPGSDESPTGKRIRTGAASERSLYHTDQSGLNHAHAHAQYQAHDRSPMIIYNTIGPGLSYGIMSTASTPTQFAPTLHGNAPNLVPSVLQTPGPVSMPSRQHFQGRPPQGSQLPSSISYQHNAFSVPSTLEPGIEQYQNPTTNGTTDSLYP